MRKTWMKCCACVLSAALLLAPMTTEASGISDTESGSVTKSVDGEILDTESDKTPVGASGETLGNETVETEGSGNVEAPGEIPKETPDTTGQEGETGVLTSEGESSVDTGTASDTYTFTFIADGKEVTLEMTENMSQVLNQVMNITQENLDSAIPAFLECAYNMAVACDAPDTSINLSLYPTTGADGTTDYNMFNGVRIPINAKAAEYIQKLKELGYSFSFNVTVYGGELIYYHNIEGATDLGFQRYPYLDYTNYDFYDSGFDVDVYDTPYAEDTAQIIWQNADGITGFFDNVNVAYTEGGQLLGVIDFNGLHVGSTWSLYGGSEGRR